MASFEDEGALLPSLEISVGTLLPPMDGLVGVHCDVLHGDLLLAIAAVAVERSESRASVRAAFSECQVSGTRFKTRRSPRPSVCQRWLAAIGSARTALPRMQ